MSLQPFKDLTISTAFLSFQFFFFLHDIVIHMYSNFHFIVQQHIQQIPDFLFFFIFFSFKSPLSLLIVRGRETCDIGILRQRKQIKGAMIKMGFTILFCVKYMYCYSKHFVAIVFHERIVMFSYFISVLWCFTTFHIVSMKEQNFYHFIIEQTNLCLHV